MRSNRRVSAPPPARRAGRRLIVCLSAAALLAAGLSGVANAAPSGHYSPVGKVDRIRQGAAGIYVRGWADDQDTTDPAKVHIAVDHKRLATVLANLSRPDVAQSHPGYGSKLGFHLSTPISAGTHTVCVRVVDYPTHAQSLLKCKTLTFDFDPFGVVAALTQTPGHLTATGWAIDPNDPAGARDIIALVDGKPVADTTADQPYPNLSASQPKAGDDHGYTLTFPISEGPHKVCIEAVNVGLGANRNIQCLTRTVNFSPTGKITKLVQVPGGFQLTGYASDPDTTATTTVTITARGKNIGTVTADGAGGPKPGYAFTATYPLPAKKLFPGDRTICAIAHNLGKYGEDRTVQCLTQTFNWNPTVDVAAVTQRSPGARVTGWASDPDTSQPIKVDLYGDGKKLMRVTANGTGKQHSGHRFDAVIPLPDGKHNVCAVAINTSYGSGNSAQSCDSVSLAFEPYGKYESVSRVTGSDDVLATGWAIDPDTNAGTVPISVTVDGGTPVTGTADLSRPDIARAHPGTGSKHGFAVQAPAADDGEHTVCVSAVNVLGGSGATNLGCKILNALHPVPAAVPTNVTAIAGYGGARIVWTAPATDGGAPWTGYTVTAKPGGTSMTVGPDINATTLLGLKPGTRYTFSVVANNVAGASRPGTSPAATTEKEPPPQTSPAPISTSRYIRNVTGASTSDLATMHKEGAADAKANPSGHGYLIVLAVGGQDESRHGVILSAGIRFVSYADMVKDLNSYVDGYASQQRPSAPITFAIATNNDIDVSTSSGASFANHVINPVQQHASRYPGITIAGSDDMEPGFRAGYAASKSWLDGYLHAATAPFVFTGSADGCAWTITNGHCNNGWTMRDMYHLAGGAAPIRIINLPQIYNTTMAQQWRYISLTGVQNRHPRIDFGGALTEWTACRQAHSCGSLTGRSAWTTMWNQLNAEPKLKPTSLPYSTDLRIDS
ncbi:MAG TPA: fibronectin type III domain-containing protein [Jatrophihabitantaceae bacterium]|jgi:hypothetical protein|nr:fibronectin type III domain-containing protein [Jatrophihabitantaceae bacterium]